MAYASEADFAAGRTYVDPDTGKHLTSPLLGETEDISAAMARARESVLGGIDYAFKPQETSVAAMLKKRGFGTGAGVYAPGVSASAFRPYMDAKANATRTALTDLFFKGEELGLQKRADFRQGLALKDQLVSSYYGRNKADKIICTALLEHGMITEEDRQVTFDFKESLQAGDEINAAYQSWAKHIVPLIHKYKVMRHIWKYIVKSWVRYIKKEPTIAGAIIHYTLYAGTVLLSRLQHKKYSNKETQYGVL